MAGHDVLVVPPFDCAWLISDELRFAQAGRGCVAFEARADNDVTVVFKERAGCKHYRTDNGPCYTVVLGSHRNRRFKIEVNGKTVLETAGSMLSPGVFQRHWISVYDGLITVGKGEPGSGVLHQWVDAHPNCKVQYVGLSSWDTHVGYRNIRVLPTVQVAGAGAAVLPQEGLGLTGFLENFELADATFMVGQVSKLVPVHRILLAACCSGFPSSSLSSGEVIRLLSVEYPILKAILEYMYTGHAKVFNYEVQQLQEVAEEFGIPSLVQQCEQHRSASDDAADVQDQSRVVELPFFSGRPGNKASASPLMIPVVVEKLKVLWENEEFCDVELYLDGYGRVAKAHKLVLSAWSTPFAKMFTNGMSESNMSQVLLKDAAPAPFMAMLGYMYTGQLNLNEEDCGALLLPLLVLSDQFAIQALRNECCQRLIECVTEDSAAAILQVAADLPGCEALRDICEECFAKHFDYCTVPPALEFKELDENCLMRILQHPDVWVSSEEKVLDAVLAWAANTDGIGGWEDVENYLENHVPADLFQSRADCLQGMIPFVRFPLMPLALLQKLEVAKLCGHFPLVGDLVAEAVRYLGQDSAPGSEGDSRSKVDLRTQGRLVTFQRSCLRFNHRLSAYKELLFMSDGDRNGVFHYAGTSYGMHSWMNPVVIKTLSVTASSPPSRYTDGKALVSRTYQETSFANSCTENGVRLAWWKVDLGEHHKLMCNYYSVRQDGSTNYMRSWSLQGSLDGEAWTDLRAHQDDATISQPRQYASWPVYGARAYLPFRFFRVVLTGPTIRFSNSWSLSLCYLELYGYFR